MTTAGDYVQRSIIRRYIMIMFLALCLGLFVVAYYGQYTQNGVDQNTAKVSADTKVLDKTVEQQRKDDNLAAKTVYNLCLGENQGARGTNTVLHVLIDATRVTSAIPPTEKVSRIKLYTSIIIPLRTCSKPLVK
jgi:hypothetical protein